MHPHFAAWWRPQVIEGISRMLGDNIWANAFVGLTHGRLTSLPDNMAFGAHDFRVSLVCW